MCLCLLPGGVAVQSCWLRGLPSRASLSQGGSFSEKSWTELCQVTLKAWNVIQQLSLNFDLWPFVPAKNVSSWSKPTYSVLPQTIVVQHSVHIDWCFALIILKWLLTVESKPTSLKSLLICGDSLLRNICMLPIDQTFSDRAPNEIYVVSTCEGPPKTR